MDHTRALVGSKKSSAIDDGRDLRIKSENLSSSFAQRKLIVDAGGDRKLYSPTVGVVFSGVDLYDRMTPEAMQTLLISICCL